MTNEVEPTRPQLLLVVGAGRSGTSTVAGALARLGMSVPQPEVPADDSNPRGFYEPQWVVDFHEALLTGAGVRTNDVRPRALELAQEHAAAETAVVRLTEWLTSSTAAQDLVVKDPRTFWFHRLWRDSAAAAGLDIAFLTMLRHPAEVARSRETHYLVGQSAELRRARETANVASWCHALLVTERATRGDRRAFVSYVDLMSDWRTALRHADRSLGLGVTRDVTDAPHAIDDFIDSSLHRSKVSWDEMSVHSVVRDLAEELWSAAEGLVADPEDGVVLDLLDDLHQRYDALYGLASDLTMDQRTVDAAERRQQVRRLRQQVQRLECENARLAARPSQRARAWLARFRPRR
ncbi:sulfotransferase family protein [Nocardioides sambongensis]|uniref:sulfotransferase family protein n=1 Tax=Nocardioides sambongensis TaxID=2589074 RepID=UPI00112DBD0B|nr:sulfotransferase family protein [Nocardioides sambongensis]